MAVATKPAPRTIIENGRTHWFGQDKPHAPVEDIYLGDRFAHNPAPWAWHMVEVTYKSRLPDGRWFLELTHVHIDSQPYRITVPSGFGVFLDSRCTA